MISVVGLTVLGCVKHDEIPSKMNEDFYRICSAIKTYYVDTGQYPDAQIALEILVQEGYLEDRTKIQDQWGHAYFYELSYLDEHMITLKLITYGADGRPGGVEENRDVTFEQECPLDTAL